MNVSFLAHEMKAYLKACKKEQERNEEAAREKTEKNLVEMGYMNKNMDILPPYNGERVNDEDFTFGPGEFQYVKRIKDK